MEKSAFLKVLTLSISGFIAFSAQGQWYSQIRDNIVDTIYADDGRMAVTVKMPGIPPKDYRAPVAEYTRTSKILPLVPAFSWSFGCSATSAAMIAGHYDNMGYPNMYVGPTNNGVMPMNNSSWRDTTIAGQLRHQCPLSATCENWDGRTIPGHVDDYWRWYLAPGPDPWTVAGGGTGVQHAYGHCTADYMKTNQWLVPAEELNVDGSTSFTFWTNGDLFTDDDAETLGIDDTDGMYGFKLFMESRGYTVLSTFTQLTYDPDLDYWFDFNDFKWEIDNNRPVLIHIEGHTMVGYGYDDGGGDSIIYIHDTWDYNNHTMQWGHSYSGAMQWGVTVMRMLASSINVWDGSLNEYWGNASNWSLDHVPTAAETVVIPNFNTPVIVDYSDKVCGYLNIYPGAVLRIMGYDLSVTNDVTVAGEIEFNSNGGSLTVGDDIFWQSGSYLDENTTDDWFPEINVAGDFECHEGSNVIMNHAVVDFTGTTSGWIRVQSLDVQFYHIRNQKTGGANLGLGSSCTHSCVVAGNLYMYGGSVLASNSMYSWTLQGFLNNMGGNIRLGSGSLRFDGNPGSIGLKPNTGDYVQNLYLNTGAYTLQLDNSYSSTLTINGNLNFQSGVLDANAFTIDVNGNWTNNVGPEAFQEESSRVIFSGTGHQYVYGDENFNILEAAMGAALRVNNASYDVTCNAYDWTAGGIDVISGTFTALNLTDNGLYGSYYVNPGGVINLTQDAGQFIDLNGDMHIYGGNLNVYGGSGSSWWAYASPASIEMSGGVLNFANYGISVTTNNAFTENITGGIIKTAGGFTCSRTDFNPAGGTIELTGTADANLYHAVGSNFYSININKVAVLSDELEGDREGPPEGRVSRSILRPSHAGKSSEDHRKEPPVTRANTIVLTGNLDLNGDLTISNGILDVSVNNYLINIAGNWTNNQLSANFNERMGDVIFDGANAADINTNETFFDLTLNKTYPSLDGLELDIGITVNVLEDLYIQNGTLEMNTSSALDINDDLTIAAGAGLNANDASLNIYLAGDFTNSNTGFTTTYGFNAGSSSTVTFDGTANQYVNTTWTEETFNHLVIAKSSGNFMPYDNIIVTGDMELNSGSWDDASTFRVHKFYGDFSVASGANFYGSDGNTAWFIGSADQVISFDPALCGGSFYDVVVDKSVAMDNIPSGDENQKKAPPGNGSRSNLVTLATDIIALNSGNLTVNYGALDFNGNYFRAVGDVRIGNGGRITIDDDAWLEVGGADSLIVQSGGTLEVVGAAAHDARVKGHNSNNYAFVVQSGGNISARHGIFEHMDASGVNVQSGAIINAINNFDFCTFQNGYTGTATLLTINNDQTFTIDSAYFPTSTTTKNVTKTLNQGQVSFVGATGAFGGPAFEDDAFNRIHWAEQGRWEGTVSNDWNTAGNWGWDYIPTSAVDVVIPSGCPNYPDLAERLGVNSSAYPFDCKSLNIQTGGRLVISTNSTLYNYGTVTVNGLLSIGNDFYAYGTSVLNLESDSVKLGTASSDGRLMIFNNGTVNQNGGHLLMESLYLNTGGQFNGTLGNIHLYANGAAPSTAGLYVHDPDSYFSTFSIDLGANGSMLSSTEALDCYHLKISGGFNPFGKTVNTFYMDVYGSLAIDSGLIVVGGNGPYFHGPSGVLNMTGGTLEAGDNVRWYSGAAGNVTGGNIFIRDGWEYYAGTNVQIGAGNTLYLQESGTSTLSCLDDNSTFGTVDFDKPADPSSDIIILSAEANPMQVNGNLYLRNGNQCQLNGDLLISGELLNEAGSEIDLNTGSNLVNNGNLTLNGVLNMAGSDATVHGVYDHTASGDIVINGGNFMCDHSSSDSRSIYTINGDFTMSSGIFEVCHNHLQFSATATENITGGTIRVGGSFLSYSGNFTPAGGSVELINFNGGGSPYIEVTGGSTLYNLTVSGNTTWLIGGAGTSHLYVNNDLTINSGALDGTDDFIYLGDDWFNNAGNSGFVAGSGRVYLLGTVPSPEVQQVAGTTTFYDLTNVNVAAVVRIDGPVTVGHVYESAAGGASCQTLVVGTPFNIASQLDVSQGAFALSASAPVVNAGSLIQGGAIQVTDGTLNVDDLVAAGLYGSYTIFNGTVNLTQDAGSFFDLYANLYIYGGTMNLIGGSDVAYWPGSGAPVLEMSSGMLDFQDVGIRLLNNNMTYNITGGKVKTTGNFFSEPIISVFDPTGGEVELYGPGDMIVNLGTGSYFHDLTINKPAGSVMATRNFQVKNELDVKQGTMLTNGYTVTVGP